MAEDCLLTPRVERLLSDDIIDNNSALHGAALNWENAGCVHALAFNQRMLKFNA